MLPRVHLRDEGQLTAPFRYFELKDYLPSRGDFFHQHDFYHLVAVAKGEFEFTFPAGEALRLGPGQVGVVPPRTPHDWAGVSRSVCSTLMLAFDPLSEVEFGDLGQVFSPANPAPFRAQLERRELTPALRRLSVESRAARPARGALLRAECLRLLALVARDVLSRGEWSGGDRAARLARAAGDFMETHYRRSPSLGEIAAHVHLSPSRFSAVFRSATGQSPLRYLHELRLRRALVLVRDSDLTIAQIAAHLGFKTPQYFTRAFHVFAGQTPSAVRAVHRKQ